MKNSNLQRAKRVKNDEFYTLYPDVEKELVFYAEHFKNKTVYCNCDNPCHSAFWLYFKLNFSKLNLKKLIATYHSETGNTYKYEMTRIGKIEKTLLKGNGDFRSPECIDLLRKADIVCTNEPFSLGREFVSLLKKYDKEFLIIINKNIVTCKEVFPLLMGNKAWLGYTSPKGFLKPDGTIQKFGNIGWLTNLKTDKMRHGIFPIKTFNEKDYPRYDNYLAWEVGRVKDIPADDYIDIEINEDELEEYLKVYPDLEILEE